MTKEGCESVGVIENQHDNRGEATTNVLERATFYVHIGGRRPVCVTAATTDTIDHILKAAGIDIADDLCVFLGECLDALDEAIDVEDGEDHHSPVADRRHSPQHHGQHGGHIHCHQCLRIFVTVTYNGVEKRHRFSPSVTVESARSWALRKFGIGPVDAETLILKVVDVAVPPQLDAHLGDLVEGHHQCGVAMELVPDHGRING